MGLQLSIQFIFLVTGNSSYADCMIIIREGSLQNESEGLALKMNLIQHQTVLGYVVYYHFKHTAPLVW